MCCSSVARELKAKAEQVPANEKWDWSEEVMNALEEEEAHWPCEQGL